MAEITQIGIKVTLDDKQAKTGLANIEQSVGRLEKSNVNLSRTTDKVSKSYDRQSVSAGRASKSLDRNHVSLGKSANSAKALNTNLNNSTISMAQFLGITNRTNATLGILVNNLAYVVAGTFAMRAIVSATDNFAKFQSQITLATESAAEFATVQKELTDISLRNHVALVPLTKLYSSLGKTIRVMGGEASDATEVIDIFSKALQLSSPTATEAASATLQFTQAMGSGVLRGEEFNSIMENGRGVADALAKGLGKTTGELRGMAEAGELTAKTVINALKSQSDAIDENFAKISVTLSMATNDLRTGGMLFVGTLDDMIGASDGVATALSKVGKTLAIVADNFEIISGVLVTSTLPAMSAYIARIGIATAANGAFVASVTSATVAAARFANTPMGLAVVGLAAGVAFLTTSLEDLNKEFSKVDDIEPSEAYLKLEEALKKAEEKSNDLNASLTDSFDGWSVFAKLANAGESILRQMGVTLGYVIDQFVNYYNVLSAAVKSLTNWDSSILEEAYSKVGAAAEKFSLEIQLINQEHRDFITNLDNVNNGIFTQTQLLKQQEKGLGDVKGFLEGVDEAQTEAFDSSTLNDFNKAIGDLNFKHQNLSKTASEVAYAEAYLAAIRKGASKDQADEIATRTKWLLEEKQRLADVADAEKERQKAIQEQIDLENKLAETKRKNQTQSQYEDDIRAFDKLDEQDKLAQELTDTINDYELSVTSLGDAWKETGDAATKAIFSMVDTQNDYDKQQKASAEDQAKLDELKAENLKQLEKGFIDKAQYEKNASELAIKQSEKDIQVKQNQRDMYMALGSAAANGFAKGSAAAEAYGLVVKAMAVQDGIGATIKAWNSAPFPANVPAVALTGGAVAALLSQMGESINTSGGGSSVADIASRQATDSGVLGGGTTDSVNKSWENLQDINANQYRELQGIYTEMQDLNDNITGVVRASYAGGDFTNLASATSSNMASDSFAANTLYRGSKAAAGGYGGLLLGAATGGLGTMIAGGLAGTALGDTLFQPLDNVVGGAINTVFGGTKKSRSDYGYSIGGTLGDASVGGFETIKTKTGGGLFKKSSTSYDDNTVAIAAETEKSFDLVFQNIADSTIKLGNELDRNVTDAVNSYEISIGKISASGDSEEFTKQLNEAFSAQSDKLANDMFGDIIDRYRQVNEAAFETLSRVVTEKVATADILDQTGLKMVGDAVSVSQSLVSLAGGIKALQDSASVYVDKFFTDEEKFSKLEKSLGETFADINKSLPTTREGFRAVVESLDITTASGQEAYVALTSASEMADKYYQNLEDGAKAAQAALKAAQDAVLSADEKLKVAWDRMLGQADTIKEGLLALIGAEELLAYQREKELANIDPLLQASQERLWALQDEAKKVDELTQSHSAYKDRLSEVGGFLSGITTNIKAFVSALMLGASASGAAYAGQLALAQSGDRGALTSITQSAQGYLDSAYNQASSIDEYNRIKGGVANQLTGLTQVRAEEFLAKEITTALSTQTTDLSTVLDGLPTGLQEVVNSTEYDISALIDFAVNDKAITTDLRTLIFSEANAFDKSIALAVNATELDPDIKKLILNDTMTATATLKALVDAGADAPTIAAIMSEEMNAQATINAVLSDGVLDTTEALILEKELSSSSKISVSDNLTADQKALFNAVESDVTAKLDAKITTDGTVSIGQQAEAALKGLGSTVDDAGKALNIKGIAGLTASIGELTTQLGANQDTVAASIKLAEEAATRLRLVGAVTKAKEEFGAVPITEEKIKEYETKKATADATDADAIGDELKRAYKAVWDAFVIEPGSPEHFAAIKNRDKVFDRLTAAVIADNAFAAVSSLSGDVADYYTKKEAITEAQEALDKFDGSHATGLSYVPFDGYRAELHRGESVVTAQESNIFRGGAIVLELQSLRNELSALRNQDMEIGRTLVRNTRDIAFSNEEIAYGGTTI